MPLVYRHNSKEDHYIFHREIEGQSANNLSKSSKSSNIHSSWTTYLPPSSTIMIGKKHHTKLSSAAASIVGVIMIAGALRATAFSFAKSPSAGRFSRPALMKLSSAAGADATATENPLLQQDDLPKFKSIEPKDLTPAVNTLLEKLDADCEQFESKIQRTDTGS